MTPLRLWLLVVLVAMALGLGLVALCGDKQPSAVGSSATRDLLVVAADGVVLDLSADGQSQARRAAWSALLSAWTKTASPPNEAVRQAEATATAVEPESEPTAEPWRWPGVIPRVVLLPPVADAAADPRRPVFYLDLAANPADLALSLARAYWQANGRDPDELHLPADSDPISSPLTTLLSVRGTPTGEEFDRATMLLNRATGPVLVQGQFSGYDKDGRPSVAVTVAEDGRLVQLLAIADWLLRIEDRSPIRPFNDTGDVYMGMRSHVLQGVLTGFGGDLQVVAAERHFMPLKRHHRWGPGHCLDLLSAITEAATSMVPHLHQSSGSSTMQRAELQSLDQALDLMPHLPPILRGQIALLAWRSGRRELRQRLLAAGADPAAINQEAFPQESLLEQDKLTFLSPQAAAFRGASALIMLEDRPPAAVFESWVRAGHPGWIAALNRLPAAAGERALAAAVFAVFNDPRRTFSWRQWKSLQAVIADRGAPSLPELAASLPLEDVTHPLATWVFATVSDGPNGQAARIPYILAVLASDESRARNTWWPWLVPVHDPHRYREPAIDRVLIRTIMADLARGRFDTPTAEAALRRGLDLPWERVLAIARRRHEPNFMLALAQTHPEMQAEVAVAIDELLLEAKGRPHQPSPQLLTVGWALDSEIAREMCRDDDSNLAVAWLAQAWRGRPAAMRARALLLMTRETDFNTRGHPALILAWRQAWAEVLPQLASSERSELQALVAEGLGNAVLLAEAIKAFKNGSSAPSSALPSPHLHQ